MDDAGGAQRKSAEIFTHVLDKYYKPPAFVPHKFYRQGAFSSQSEVQRYAKSWIQWFQMQM